MNTGQKTIRGNDLRARIEKYLYDYTVRYQIPPTFRNIAKALGIRSTSVVQYHIGILIREGKVKRVGGERQAHYMPTPLRINDGNR